MDVMLLVAAIAAVVMHIIGLTLRRGRLARGFQVNTQRKRSALSTFFLGKLTFKERLEDQLPIRSLRDSVRELLAMLQSVERIPT